MVDLNKREFEMVDIVGEAGELDTLRQRRW